MDHKHVPLSELLLRQILDRRSNAGKTKFDMSCNASVFGTEHKIVPHRTPCIDYNVQAARPRVCRSLHYFCTSDLLE